jgi:hypothetical protein
MNRNEDRRLDQLLDQALRDFPLDPVPNDLKDKIMGRIDKPQPTIVFRIPWFDFAFSGVLAVVIGFVLGFLQNVARSPYWVARIRVALIHIWQDMRYFMMHNYRLVMTAALSSLMVLALLAVLASVYWRYAVSSKHLPA